MGQGECWHIGMPLCYKGVKMTILISMAFIVVLCAAFGTDSHAAEHRDPVFDTWGTELPDNALWIVNSNKLLKQGWRKIEFEPEQMMELTAEESEAGHVPYLRHYTETITVSSRPQRDEIKRSITLFACPGEYEPAAFNIFFLKAARGVTARVTPLKDNKGDVISLKNLDLRVVSRLPTGVDNRTVKNRKIKNAKLTREKVASTNILRDKPWVLEKRSTADIGAEDTLQYWFTVYVPENTSPTIKPGQLLPATPDAPELLKDAYKGEVIVRIPGGNEIRFKVNLVVLPFKLDEPEILYGMFFLPGPLETGMFPDNLDKQMIDMREHGMNSMSTWPDVKVTKTPSGDYKWDFTRSSGSRKSYFYHSFEEITDAYMRAGFDRFWCNGSLETTNGVIKSTFGYKFGSDEWVKAYTSFMVAMREYAETKGLPDYGVQCIDEPDQLETTLFMLDLIGERFPKEKRVQTGNPSPLQAKTIPHVDIFFSGQTTPQNIARLEEASVEFWSYNTTNLGRELKVDRGVPGFGAKKIKTKCVFQWAYQWWGTTAPAMPLSGCGYTHPSPNGPVPSPAWECLREATDDMKYIQTMENLAGELGSENGLAEESRQLLDGLLYEIPGGNKPVMAAYYREGLMDHIPGTSLDERRWALARMISAMRKVLDETRDEATGRINADMDSYVKDIRKAWPVPYKPQPPQEPGKTIAYWRFEDVDTNESVCVSEDLSGRHGYNDIYSPGLYGYSGDPPYAVGHGAEKVPMGIVPQTGQRNKKSIRGNNVDGFLKLQTIEVGTLSSFTPTAWTVEMALRPKRASGTLLFRRKEANDTSVSGDPFALTVTVASEVQVEFRGRDDSLYKFTSQPKAITANKWQVMAIVCDGRTISAYMNYFDGKGYLPVGSTAVTGAGDKAMAASGIWQLESDMNVLIDEVRISDHALKPTEFLFVSPPRQ